MLDMTEQWGLELRPTSRKSHREAWGLKERFREKDKWKKIGKGPVPCLGKDRELTIGDSIVKWINTGLKSGLVGVPWD